MMEKDNPGMNMTDTPELKNIENYLTCGICYELIDIAVMTPCSHNYCSLCIRKYLSYKTECPQCFNQVFDTDLRVNRIIDSIKQNFLKFQEKLKNIKKINSTIDRSLVTGLSSSPVKSRISSLFFIPNEGNKISSFSHKKEFNSTTIKSTENESVISNQKQSLTNENNDTQEIDNPVNGENSEKHISSPSTSGIAPIFKAAKCRTLFKKDGGPTVPCPVCNVSVSETHINRHLDACLQRESNTTGPIIHESKLKPIPKLVLNLMKDIELRRRLKEYGLTTTGDTKALRARLNKFYILYNVERDRTIQRSILEIVKQCEDEEQHEKKAILPNLGNKLHPSKTPNTNPKNDNYCEENRSSFDKLIEQIRNRNRTSENRKEGDNVIDSAASNDKQIIQDSEKTSTRRKTEDENLEEEEELINEIQESALVNQNLNSSLRSLVTDSYFETESSYSIRHSKDIPDVSSDSNIINEKTEIKKREKFVPKKARMTRSLVSERISSSGSISDIEVLDQLLQNNESELNDISLDTSGDLNESNESEDLEESEEISSNNSCLNGPNSTNLGKENEPSNLEAVELQKSTRKRGRSSCAPNNKDDSVEESFILRNHLHDSTVFEVALDGSIDEVESSPDNILKHKRIRVRNDNEEVMSPKRILRSRIIDK